MFFDGGSDPFSSAFGSSGARSSSPVGGSSAAVAGRAGLQTAWNNDDHFGHHHGFDGFSRERNNSGSSGGGSGASTASTGEERVIPIQIIRDDPPKAQQQSQPQQQTRGKSPAPLQQNDGPSRIAIQEKSPQSQQPPSQENGRQRCNSGSNHSILVEESRAAGAHSTLPSQHGVGPKVPGETVIDNLPQATQIGGNYSKTPKPEKQIPIPIIVEGRKGATFNSTLNGNCASQSPPQAKVSRPADRSPTSPPKKQALPKDPLAKVSAVLDIVKELEKQVEEFKGNSREDRDFLILDEMLTRCLIKLDVVETGGRDDVRTSRKDCIKYIQGCISKLENKVPTVAQPEENANEQPMETGHAKAGETEKMETGSQPTTESSQSADTKTQGRLVR